MCIQWHTHAVPNQPTVKGALVEPVLKHIGVLLYFSSHFHASIVPVVTAKIKIKAFGRTDWRECKALLFAQKTKKQKNKNKNKQKQKYIYIFKKTEFCGEVLLP